MFHPDVRDSDRPFTIFTQESFVFWCNLFSYINQLPFILYFHPCRPGCQILGVASLLRKYCSLLVSHVSGIMPTATSVGDMSDRSFAATCAVLSRDVTGKCIGILSMF